MKFFILGIIVLFSIYVIDVVHKFGIPSNLCVTYYYFERIRHKKGLLFPFLLVLLCGSLIPIWLYTCKQSPIDTSNYVWCIWATLFFVMLVGITCRYKRNKKHTYIHYTSAILASVCAIIWMLVACFSYSYIAFAVLLISTVAGILTKTMRKCYLFWLELAAFYALFFQLFVLNLSI